MVNNHNRRMSARVPRRAANYFALGGYRMARERFHIAFVFAKVLSNS
jgi:hypothetical protein